MRRGVIFALGGLALLVGFNRGYCDEKSHDPVSSAQDLDYDGNKKTDTRRTKVYDDKKRLVEDRWEFDDDEDGTFDGEVVFSYGFDSGGRTISVNKKVKGSVNRSVCNDRVATYKFDEKGELVERFDSAGQRTERSEYEGGNLTRYFLESDTDWDEVADFSMSEEITYDEKGRKALQIVDTNRKGDKKRRVVTYLYAGDGSEIQEFRKDLDGEVDFIVRKKRKFDNKGRKIEEVSGPDKNLDGKDDSVVCEGWGYDEAGRMTMHSEKRDEDGDGEDDSVVCEGWGYDEAGRMTTHNTKTANGGTIEEEVEEILEWGDDGRKKQHTCKFYIDGRETPAIRKDRPVYDKDGEQIGFVSTFDDDGDGVTDSTSIVWQLMNGEGGSPGDVLKIVK